MECKELDKAMTMLDMVDPADKQSAQALAKVKDLLLMHSSKMGEMEGMAGDMGEPDEMDDMGDMGGMHNSPSPYNAGNMRERSPYAKR